MTPNGFASLLVVVAAGLCVGCKKDLPPPPVAQDTTPPPPAPEPLAVVGVDLGRAVGSDHRVTAPATVFTVRDTIYASVATVGVAPTATLVAKWTLEPDKLVDSTVASIAPTGPATTAFHVIRTSPWPVGKYRVVILLDDKKTMEREFEVKK